MNKNIVVSLKFFFVIALFVGVLTSDNIQLNVVVELFFNSNFSWEAVALSLLLMAFHIVLVYLSFYQLFDVVGVNIAHKKMIGIFLYSNVAKYIPGGVWQAGSRVYALSQLGVTVDKSLAILLMEVIVSVVLSAVIAMGFYQYWWPLLVSTSFSYWTVVIALAVVAIGGYLGVAIIPRVISKRGQWANLVARSRVLILNRSTAIAVFLHFLSFVAFAASYWVCTYAVLDVGVIEFQPYFGVLMAATLVGFLAFFAPAGFGVREGILFSFLLTVCEANIALILSTIPRLLSLFLDFFAAALFFLCRRCLRAE